MDITTDDICDSKVLPSPVMDASRHRLIAKHIWMEHITYPTPILYLGGLA
jgi:hypothetical protein